MVRALFYLFLISLAVKAGCGRWPWQMTDRLLSWPGRNLPSDRARMLLGVDHDASRADILDAHRRLIIRVHPDRGGTASLVHEANAARDLLLRDLGSRNKEQA